MARVITDNLDDLILELSLAASVPVGIQGTNYIHATSASNSFALQAKELPAQRVKELSNGIEPLLALLHNDIDHPVAGKAALSLRTLMSSRTCILELIRADGLKVMSSIFQKLFSGKKVDLVSPSTHRIIVEHCAAVFREIGRFYPWKIVRVGILRHVVVILKNGDLTLKTIGAGILAAVSNELEICKLMFTNGCVKPLLDVALEENTNEACTLAALGSIVQLSRLPEIAVRVFEQGALPLLERSLHTTNCLNDYAIREKALYALHWLSRPEEIRSKIPTDPVLCGMARELRIGTVQAQLTVVEMLLKLHNHYPALEERFVTESIDEIIRLLNTGPWSTKNLCAKCICVLYKSNSNKMYLVKKGCMGVLLRVMNDKNDELQEVPLVAFLSLLAHPDIPKLFLDMPDGLESLARLVLSSHEVIRELAVVIMKALRVFDIPKVTAAIPAQKMYMFTPEDNIPTRVGEEYGEMIEEYLQEIVENRRDQHYLLDQVVVTSCCRMWCRYKQLNDEDWKNYAMTRKDIQPYQDTFMELDPTCKGTLDIDELKVVMVTLGYVLDEDELQEILAKYDKHQNGYLSFKEFMYMIIDWNTRFGSGAKRIYNTALQRGPIGRARRQLSRWLGTTQRIKNEIDEARNKRLAAVVERQNLAAEHWDAEKIRLKREREIKLNASRSMVRE